MSGSGGLSYSAVRPSVAESDLAALAPYMFWLMFRNVASDGLVFDDPVHPGIVSAPGCVLASPSWENTATQVTQDYVYHWTSDAAIVALELSAAYTAGTLPTNQPLIDYVTFSADLPGVGGRLRPGELLHQRHASARGPTRPTAPRCRRSPCWPCTASSTRPPRRPRPG